MTYDTKKAADFKQSLIKYITVRRAKAESKGKGSGRRADVVMRK